MAKKQKQNDQKKTDWIGIANVAAAYVGVAISVVAICMNYKQDRRLSEYQDQLNAKELLIQQMSDSNRARVKQLDVEEKSRKNKLAVDIHDLHTKRDAALREKITELRLRGLSNSGSAELSRNEILNDYKLQEERLNQSAEFDLESIRIQKADLNLKLKPQK